MSVLEWIGEHPILSVFLGSFVLGFLIKVLDFVIYVIAILAGKKRRASSPAIEIRSEIAMAADQKPPSALYLYKKEYLISDEGRWYVGSGTVWYRVPSFKMTEYNRTKRLCELSQRLLHATEPKHASMDLLVEIGLCGGKKRTQCVDCSAVDSVYYNQFNDVVQCHSCGKIYEPRN